MASERGLLTEYSFGPTLRGVQLCLEALLVVTKEKGGIPLDFSGERAKMLFKTLQCSGQPQVHTNISGIKVKSLYFRVIVSSEAMLYHLVD